VPEPSIAVHPSAPSDRHLPPAIAVRSLTHSYGDRKALDAVSFEVAPAEIFGLLGPNGSGKTTLFRILSTLMLATSGRAEISGRDAALDPKAVRRQIGVVFQSPSVDVKLTAAENLHHQGHLYGLTGLVLNQRVRETLERVGLSDRAGEKVETFSGGMQRRVELAKGLMHRPAVLLLDEPTTGLDPGARIDLWQYLKILRDQEQVSVLITTHLMEEAERCDRLAILNSGTIVALGAPAQLKQEIGDDVMLIEAQDAASLALRMKSRFQVSPSLVGGNIRLEKSGGHQFATRVVEAFPGEVISISVSKPTLEDVFIRRTGHRFWSEADGAPGSVESAEGSRR
jgi:ABC-2 type transport system ATP-binding protein